MGFGEGNSIFIGSNLFLNNPVMFIIQDPSILQKDCIQGRVQALIILNLRGNHHKGS